MPELDIKEPLGFMSLSNSSADLPENNATVALVEGENDSTETIQEENLKFNGVVSFVKTFFDKAKSGRYADEQRWLNCYRNHRGIYGPDVVFTSTEKSRAFIKITKTKVLASYAKVVDVLFSGKKFPLGIEPSRIPIGIADTVSFDSQVNPQMMQQEKEAPEQPGTITRQDIFDKLGPLKEKLELVKDLVKEGPSATPTSSNFEPAHIAAKKMEKKIHDQLDEASADKHLRSFVFEMCLFGTGVMKGPFAIDKEYSKWDDDGKYTPERRIIPGLTQVSIWDFYPDPDARTIDDCEGIVHRHRMTRAKLHGLKKRPFFRTESINLAIEAEPNYVEESWEPVLNDFAANSSSNRTRYEVLEFWGVIDPEILIENDIEIPEDLEDRDLVNVNIWICNDQILRLVFNPFIPERIPFYACPYEINPYSFFGIGVAENMLDTQLAMNGFYRLAIDNAVLSSNLVFEVDETMLVPGQDTSVYPGKVFRRQGGQPGQALYAEKFPNVTQECLLLFDKARQLSDESTGIPSYAHGMTGVMSTGRTASGMSMLMGAADQNIKSVVLNIDDYLIHPMGKSLFAFNMQFDFDPDIKGDLSVIAKGTESLMRNEVRSQRLLQFLQITNNPADAPFVRRDYALREFAESLDLDPEKIINDPREAILQAMKVKEFNQAMGINPEQQQAGQQGGNPAGVASVADSSGTGGGNIQPGNAPEPTSQGFTGNTEGGQVGQ